MPRATYHRLEPSSFDYDARSTKRHMPTAWKHNLSAGRSSHLVNANGDYVQGDGTDRHSLQHPVLVGTPAGRPENEYEALMQCAPGQEPLEDSEGLDSSQGRVDALLALLPLRQRQVAALIVGERLSVREAADHLDISKSQVDRDWASARKELAALLGYERPDERVTDALEEMVPDDAPDLGEYRRDDGVVVGRSSNGSPSKAERPATAPSELAGVGKTDPAAPPPLEPPVAPEEWAAYDAAVSRMRGGRADAADFDAIRAFERRLSLPSSFSPAWV